MQHRNPGEQPQRYLIATSSDWQIILPRPSVAMTTQGAREQASDYRAENELVDPAGLASSTSESP